MASKLLYFPTLDMVSEKLKKQNLLMTIELKKFYRASIMTKRQKNFYVEDTPPVDLYLISEKSIWKNQVKRTEFLVYFELDIYCLSQ